MAFARAWMLLECLLAVFCVLSIGVHGKNNTTIASSTISRLTTSSHHLTSTPTVMPAASSSSIKPTPTTSVSSVTVTVTPKPTPSKHSTVPTHGYHSSTPTSKPGNHSSTVPTTNVKPSSVTPTPKGHNSNGGSGSSSGKWVATAFAVFFGITTIVMTILYCRQRKIYRELEGDSSLSRLI